MDTGAVITSPQAGKTEQNGRFDFDKEARELLLHNRLVTEGYHYTVPSTTTYPYQWLWDSCFHAISLSHFDLDAAKKEIISLISAQFPNGMLPHMIYWAPGKLHNYDWGNEGTSTITQPPMLAYAVERIFEREKDKEFLEQVYPAMYRFYTYLVTMRDPRDNHLIGIINPDESGEDNSPRFDSLLNLGAEQTLEENLRRRMILIEKNRICNFDAASCMKKFFWVKDVPFNAIAVENMRILAKLAEILGRSDDADFLESHADLQEKAMREKMFEDGVFWSTQGENYEKIKIKTWAIFSPLFAGLYTPEEASAILEKYFWNPNEFKTPYMVPTVSVSEESYDPGGFWRGPVWSAVNWFIYKGLMRYGFVKEAEHVRESLQQLIEKSGFREYFRPDTGEGLGAMGFTWGTLLMDMNDELSRAEQNS